MYGGGKSLEGGESNVNVSNVLYCDTYFNMTQLIRSNISSILVSVNIQFYVVYLCVVFTQIKSRLYYILIDDWYSVFYIKIYSSHSRFLYLYKSSIVRSRFIVSVKV